MRWQDYRLRCLEAWERHKKRVREKKESRRENLESGSSDCHSGHTERNASQRVEVSVEAGSELFTDAARGYNGLSETFKHSFVDHAVKYAEGRVTTNGIENFWSLFDRIVHGTYIKPEPQHLLRYVDEQVFRFNERGGTDLTRFIKCIMQVSGKRLTYEELITSHLKNMM